MLAEHLRGQDQRRIYTAGVPLLSAADGLLEFLLGWQRINQPISLGEFFFSESFMTASICVLIGIGLQGCGMVVLIAKNKHLLGELSFAKWLVYRSR